MLMIRVRSKNWRAGPALTVGGEKGRAAVVTHSVMTKAAMRLEKFTCSERP